MGGEVKKEFIIYDMVTEVVNIHATEAGVVFDSEEVANGGGGREESFELTWQELYEAGLEYLARQCRRAYLNAMNGRQADDK